MRKIGGLFSLILYLTSAAWAEEPGKNPYEIKVGAIYALTGDWASWGKNCQQGTELALAKLNEDPTNPELKLIIEDSPNAKPTNAISAFRKLVDIDHVKFILGPMSPEEYSAVAPLADRGGIPILPFVSSRIQIPAAAFMWMDPETEAQRIAAHVAVRHKSVAILSSNQEWDVQVGQSFKKHLLEKGISIPIIEEPPFESTEVRTQVAKLATKKYDAIFITSYLLLPKYLKQIQAAKIQVPTYSIEIDSSAIATSGKAAEGLQFIRPAAPDNKFIETYRNKWGADPDIPATQCYDSVMILNRAIRAGVIDSKSFTDYFKVSPTFQGASGKISIQRGKTVMSTDLFEVKNGRMVRLMPLGE
jgi:branched-chain amino acid transport system substrate-binding protein